MEVEEVVAAATRGVGLVSQFLYCHDDIYFDRSLSVSILCL